MSIHTFYPPAAGDACGGSFAASGDGPAGGGGRRPGRACRSSWDAAMGPRLGDPLQTNFLALGKKVQPGRGSGGPGRSKKIGDKTTL